MFRVLITWMDDVSTKTALAVVRFMHRSRKGLNAKHTILTATFQLNFESRAIDSTCVAPTKEQSSFTEERRDALRSFIAEAMGLAEEKQIKERPCTRRWGGWQSRIDMLGGHRKSTRKASTRNSPLFRRSMVVTFPLFAFCLRCPWSPKAASDELPS